MPFGDFLRHSAAIRLQASGQDALGGLAREPADPVASGVPCLVRRLGVAAQAELARRGTVANARIYFAADLGLTDRHEIAVGDAVFRVVGQVDANGMGRVVAVDCDEVVT